MFRRDDNPFLDMLEACSTILDSEDPFVIAFVIISLLGVTAAIGYFICLHCGAFS